MIKAIEAYNIWKQKYVPERDGMTCKCARIEGGPGWIAYKCIHLSHPSVKYGCDGCPANCRDYAVRESVVDFEHFWKLMHCASPSDILETYGIDVNDIDELNEEKAVARNREQCAISSLFDLHLDELTIEKEPLFE